MHEPIAVAVLGASEESCALIKVLKSINFVNVAMVIGMNDEPAILLARRTGIATSSKVESVLDLLTLDVIVNMNCDDTVVARISKSPAAIVSGPSLRLFLYLVQEKEQLTDIRRLVEKVYDRLGEITTTAGNLYHLPSALKEEKHNDIVSLDKMEQMLLKQALRKYGSSVEGKKRAAKALNISLATLYNKLKKYQIS